MTATLPGEIIVHEQPNAEVAQQTAELAGAAITAQEVTVTTVATGERVPLDGSDPTEALSGAPAVDNFGLTRVEKLDMRVRSEMSPRAMALAQLSIMGLTKSDFEAASDKARAAEAAARKARHEEF